MSGHQLHARHERRFADNRFVYPVLSRRAAGLSIGVNLNPDKTCNFDCIYCQVDRRTQSETQFVETERLLDELDRTITLVVSGALYETDKFRSVEAVSRRLRDIAFSGDGEPTTYKNFDEIVEACAALKRRRRLRDVQLVLITNASMLHRPKVQRALEILDRNNGRIWAKLEAGTERYWRLVERTPIPRRVCLQGVMPAPAQGGRAPRTGLLCFFIRCPEERSCPNAARDRRAPIWASRGRLRPPLKRSPSAST